MSQIELITLTAAVLRSGKYDTVGHAIDEAYRLFDLATDVYDQRRAAAVSQMLMAVNDAR